MISHVMVDATECTLGSKEEQGLCCPASADILWRGFHNNGKCKGGCNNDEANVDSITASCRSSYQSACCTTTVGQIPDPGTKEQQDVKAMTPTHMAIPTLWSDVAMVRVAPRRARLVKIATIVVRMQCRMRFTTCDWHGHKVSFINTEFCINTCPAVIILIAAQTVLTVFNSLLAHTYWRLLLWQGYLLRVINGVHD